MTPQEAAAKLDGNEYGEEGSKELFAEMKAAGLVAVFGASDDLMEFRGAIYDEVECYGGGAVPISSAGLPENKCQNDECPYHAERTGNLPTIKAVWGIGGFAWQYETTIPHATFVIKEDGEPYCKGIVFALADVAGQYLTEAA